MPIMASFVHVTTGADTANADDHKWKWMRFASDDLSSWVKIFQPWLKTNTVGTVTVYSWTDIVALWAEVGATHCAAPRLMVVNTLHLPAALHAQSDPPTLEVTR